MNIKRRAHLVVTISAIIFVVANTVIFLTVVHPPQEFISSFININIINIVVLTIVTNIAFFPMLKIYNKNVESLQSDTEAYKKYLEKLGGLPLRSLIIFLLSTVGIILYNNIYLKSHNFDADTANSYRGLMIAISMVSSSFVYVIYDKLVSLALYTNGVNRYCISIKSNRQQVKSIIIPTFIGIMSTLSTYFLVFITLINMPSNTEDLTGYVAKSTIPPLLIILTFIIGLIYLWSTSTKALFKNLNGRLKEMTSDDKDLTKRITISSVDELGLMSYQVNQFSDIITDYMIKTKNIVNILNNNQKSLSESIAESTKDVNEVDKRVQDNISIVNKNNDIVQKTLNNGKELIQFSSDVATQVEVQTQNVAESSAAVEEMIASVKEVTHRTTVVKERTNELSSEFDFSKSKITETIHSINNVVELSKNLIDINKIISGIAARTNLLAMNAAIEAAHAGEAGRGFSVVAQEIRNLAENTATQTKTSSENLKEVLEQINKSVDIANETGSSFEKMKGSLTVVENETASISFAMEEHDRANNEVLEQLENTNDLAHRLNDISTSLIKQGEMMLHNLEELDQTSKDSLKNAEDIKNYNNQLTAVMDNINKLSQEADKTNKQTMDLVNSFKVE